MILTMENPFLTHILIVYSPCSVQHITFCFSRAFNLQHHIVTDAYIKPGFCALYSFFEINEGIRIAWELYIPFIFRFISIKLVVAK